MNARQRLRVDIDRREITSALDQQLVRRLVAEQACQRRIDVEESAFRQAAVDALGSRQIERAVEGLVVAGLRVTAGGRRVQGAEQHPLAILFGELDADLGRHRAAVGPPHSHRHARDRLARTQPAPEQRTEAGIGPEPDLDRQPAEHGLARPAGATLERAVDAEEGTVTGTQYRDDAFR
jgi:hypothetical protein